MLAVADSTGSVMGRVVQRAGMGLLLVGAFSLPYTAKPLDTLPKPPSRHGFTICSEVLAAPSTTMRADLREIMWQPNLVYGWKMVANPNLANGPHNPRRRSLGLRNSGSPYNRLYNGFVFRAGCSTNVPVWPNGPTILAMCDRFAGGILCCDTYRDGAFLRLAGCCTSSPCNLRLSW